MFWSDLSPEALSSASASHIGASQIDADMLIAIGHNHGVFGGRLWAAAPSPSTNGENEQQTSADQ
jgi:hypothetical protein